MSMDSGAQAFLNDFNGKVFRVWKYKRMFTPLEQEKKWVDQSEFVDDQCEFVFINRIYDVFGHTVIDYCPVEMAEYDDDGNITNIGYHEFEELQNIHLALLETDTQSLKDGEL